MFHYYWTLVILTVVAVASPTWTGSSNFGRDYRDERVGKDGSLEGLAHILNSAGNRRMFRDWQDSMNDTQDFLAALEPWILASPTAPLVLPRAEYVDGEGIQCSDPLYETVLTGNRQERETTIVDFVPFGYDVDKLLLRFIETWDAVDVYVIYEMPYTLLGIPKSLYFPRKNV